MNRILVYGMTANKGGIETYLVNEMKMLDPGKAVFDFVCDFETIAYREELEAAGSRIYFIPSKRKGLFKQWKELKKICEEHPEYRIVYFNVMDAGQALTMRVPKKCGRQIVVHSHNSKTDKPRLHKLFKSYLNRIADKRYACSDAAAEHMFGSRSAVVIPNAVDVNKYAYSEEKRERIRRELGIGPSDPVLLHVGRLSAQKNVKRLLDIYREMLKTDENIRLLSVGTGEDKEQIEAYARQIGIFEKVNFLGLRSDVDALMSAADVCVLPSLYEGLTLVGIEAQAAGLPCVFSDKVDPKTKIKEDVVFVPLEESNKRWGEVIMAYAGKKRDTDNTALSDRGFDIEHPGEAQRELTAFFEA